METSNRCPMCGTRTRVWEEKCPACGEPDPISKLAETNRREAVKLLDNVLEQQRDLHTVRTTNDTGGVIVHHPTLRALGARFGLILIAHAFIVAMLAFLDLRSGNGPFDMVGGLLSFLPSVLFDFQSEHSEAVWQLRLLIVVGYGGIVLFLAAFTYKVLRFRRVEKALLARRRRIIAIREPHGISPVADSSGDLSRRAKRVKKVRSDRVLDPSAMNPRYNFKN